MIDRKDNALEMKDSVHTEILKDHGHERLRELILLMAPLAFQDSA